MDRIKKISVSFFVIAFIFLMLGVFTYGFYPVDGQITKNNSSFGVEGTQGIMPKGPILTVKGPRKVNSWTRVRYAYDVDGRTYRSGFLGLYLPYNIDLGFEPVIGGKAIVYVHRWWPAISILKQGIDFRIVIIPVILGACLLAIRFWLLGMIITMRNEENDLK